MKKRKLDQNALKLNKNVVSNLAGNEIKGGGFTNSCIADPDTNCAAITGPTVCLTAVNCPYSRTCPPTEICL